ncbi:MAG: metallophosphatase domain-containing protein [Arcicella sp.]|nr:metallophosphatase domain-containing protein [Arcicella sp.]
MKLICISDTHNLHNNLKVPDGDILIHAGDMTCVGGIDEIKEFNEWLGTLPHRHKIIIAGNHDIYFEGEPTKAKLLITNAIYLEDSGITLEGLKIWGSPISPNYQNWAFNRERGEAIKKHWDLIPHDTDILITHCPPFGILDFDSEGKPEGCEELLTIVQQKIKPRLHVFGHLHDAHGQTKIGETLFINASIVSTVQYPKWLKMGRDLAISIFQILKKILPTKKSIRLNRKAYELQIKVVFSAVEITYQQK